jgi:hypothetical protein
MGTMAVPPPVGLSGGDAGEVGPWFGSTDSIEPVQGLLLQLVEVTARLHALVQNAKDLDDALPIDAVVENMDWVPDAGDFSGRSGMPDMEAADTRAKLEPLPRKRPLRLSRDLPHGSGENGGVPLPGAGAPALGTDGKDTGEIDLRWASEAEPRHPALPHRSRGGRRQPVEIRVEIGVVDVYEVAAIERFDASLDLRAQRLQPETVFLPALLERSQRVPDRLAGVLVFARLDNLLDKGVLLGRQADVARGHLDLGDVPRIALMAKLANDAPRALPAEAGPCSGLPRCPDCRIRAHLRQLYGPPSRWEIERQPYRRSTADSRGSTYGRCRTCPGLILSGSVN